MFALSLSLFGFDVEQKEGLHLRWLCIWQGFTLSRTPHWFMPTIDFSTKELASLKAHYASEHQRLTAQLSHVESMLQKLGAPRASESKRQGPTMTAKGVPAKKRGPKSIWGAFIQKRLRARNRPMSYEELITDAMSVHKISAERRDSVKASILNSAFRLRTVHGKITTVGRPGKKDKMVVLTKWLDEEGALNAVHVKAFKAAMGGKPQRVNMSTIPVSPYSEE